MSFAPYLFFISTSSHGRKHIVGQSNVFYLLNTEICHIQYGFNRHSKHNTITSSPKRKVMVAHFRRMQGILVPMNIAIPGEVEYFCDRSIHALITGWGSTSESIVMVTLTNIQTAQNSY